MKLFGRIAVLAAALLFLPSAAKAATLLVEPQTGTFTVGDTFNVSVYLDTQGKSVNALDVKLQFPTDKLQVVSPATGQSIIGVWTAPPSFNNQAGTVEFQGGIPGGINASKGLIAVMTFRVYGVGDAVLKFSSDSKVLANDGKATNILVNSQNGVFNLTLPPPRGPIVSSETHPDQSKWYSNSTAILSWSSINPVEGYSYVLDNTPVENPPDISVSSQTSVVYKSLKDGIYYFHIKAVRGGAWGGVTDFAVKIDTAPPADFKIDASPSLYTSDKQPTLEFSTTDALSGLDHYEMRIIPLGPAKIPGDTPLFFEAQSPFIMQNLDNGSYDITVRAYDDAGNFREETARLTVTPSAFGVIQEQGLQIGNLAVPWSVFWILSLFLALLLGYLARWAKFEHDKAHKNLYGKNWPSEISERLERFKDMRKRYSKKIFAVLLSAAALGMLFGRGIASAQQIPVKLSPPVVNAISKDISNEEIFYVGGKSDPQSQVIVYLQNLQGGQTFSEAVAADNDGNWFWRNDSFMSPGTYLVWAQSKIGDLLSPPSPQFQVNVSQTALQFGSTRISYEFLYFVLMIAFFLVMLGLVIYTWFHWRSAVKKRKIFNSEVKDMEESIRRGFAVLRGDVMAELALINRSKLAKELSDSEKTKEEQLLKDLRQMDEIVGKEIWEMNKLKGAI